MSEQVLSISDAQKELTRLSDQFAEQSELEAITVTRYGKPVMTIVPSDTYKTLKQTIDELQEQVEALQETLEIVQDDELMAAFRQGVKELEEGKGKMLDDVLRELGWE